MEILFMWIATTVASVGIELASDFKVIKDLADAGYKMDIKRVSEITEQLFPDATKTTLLSLFVPVYNLFHAMKSVKERNEANYMLLDQFQVFDLLEEMSDEEKEEYAKKPTGFHAIQITARSDMKLQEASSMQIGECEVFYTMDEENGNVIILKVKGNRASLSGLDITDLILKSNEKEFRENFSVEDLTDDKKEHLTSSDRVQALMNLRNDLEKQKKGSTEPEEKCKTYIKK